MTSVSSLEYYDTKLLYQWAFAARTLNLRLPRFRKCLNSVGLSLSILLRHTSQSTGGAANEALKIEGLIVPRALRYRPDVSGHNGLGCIWGCRSVSATYDSPGIRKYWNKAMSESQRGTRKADGYTPSPYLTIHRFHN